ncbi:MAG: hypothetical protein QF511_10600 [Rhodospirillales bacterium]|jgi:hypothetical protein|nr:hypothetical protein [Rhodospirillales bacterium]MDP7098938.1 hypothetical protein [Rhodospirillales bacterium]MDP7214649.1 hypothetical protein [Rhodospirillales bacterium]
MQIFLEKSLDFSMLASYYWSERDTHLREKNQQDNSAIPPVTRPAAKGVLPCEILLPGVMLALFWPLGACRGLTPLASDGVRGDGLPYGCAGRARSGKTLALKQIRKAK